MKYQTHKRQVSSINLCQGGREKTPTENGKRSELFVYSVSMHSKSRQNKKARYEYRAFYTIQFFCFPFFLRRHWRRRSPCATIWAPKGKTTRFGLLDFIVTIEPMMSHLYQDKHTPHRHNPRWSLVRLELPQILWTSKLYRIRYVICILKTLYVIDVKK